MDCALEEKVTQNQHPDRAYQVLRGRLMTQLETGQELSDEEIYAKIDALLVSADTGYLRLSRKMQLRGELFNSVRRLDLLSELLDDPENTEIMINGTRIFRERAGKLEEWDRAFESLEKVEDLVQQIAAGCNRVANESTAIVDARLRGGARVNIVMRPVAVNGPIITIRRFPDNPITMEQLIRWNSISREAAHFLGQLVKAGYNIFISGGTGSGKTTFLNALSAAIPKDERLVVIEDNSELQIQNIDNLVRLEARRANEEGEHAVTIRDLIRASLRMRPDRVIVGEVRGEETVDMLQAMNTGHDGSLSTGHGNSPLDMLSRLETMYLMGGIELPLQAIRRQIASGLDIMVHLGRLRDKTRRVLEIIEIDGFDYRTGEIMTHQLFELKEYGEEKSGRLLTRLEQTGELRNIGKMQRSGVKMP